MDFLWEVYKENNKKEGVASDGRRADTRVSVFHPNFITFKVKL